MVKPRILRNQYTTTQGFWQPQHDQFLASLELEFQAQTGDMTPGVRRSTRTAVIPATKTTAPLFQLLQSAIEYHNREFYGFKLMYIQDLQLHEYSEGSEYSPHHDWGGVIHPERTDLCRKLSFSIQLSDPQSYEGGDLEFYYGEPWTEEHRARIRARNTLICWPGFVLHGVTPVTHGVRRSLVGFCVGPDFE